GYVTVTNSSGTAIPIPPNTILTASTGQQYTTGITSYSVPGSSSADVFVTAIEAGIGYNIPAGIVFDTGITNLTGVNTLPFLSGADAESDAIYLNRITGEKTEYGTQNGSVAVETELKQYYQDAKIYVNQSVNALTAPVPVPGNGYNLIVRTPNGINATAAEISQIFSTLSNRLEFVNAQSAGSALHRVNSGVIYTSEIPQNYYYTVAQPVSITLTGVINVRAFSTANRLELIEQANDFATYFINRIMSLLSGIDGTTNVTYEDDEYADVITAVSIAGNPGIAGTTAPKFGIATIRDLVSDMETMFLTPQILYDSVASLSMVINPNVGGEASVTLAIGGGTQFIDFVNDILFTDGTSWYDRYVFIDPANINLTIKVTEWI
ncbi:MAG: baseplate J/gp47 family protein, partial [Ignavibacteria bacterium]|nr:baseplate J/gp47 family protein [Ignavibacteria bacterium]